MTGFKKEIPLVLDFKGGSYNSNGDRIMARSVDSHIEPIKPEYDIETMARKFDERYRNSLKILGLNSNDLIDSREFDVSDKISALYGMPKEMRSEHMKSVSAGLLQQNISLMSLNFYLRKKLITTNGSREGVFSEAKELVTNRIKSDNEDNHGFSKSIITSLAEMMEKIETRYNEVGKMEGMGKIKLLSQLFSVSTVWKIRPFLKKIDFVFSPLTVDLLISDEKVFHILYNFGNRKTEEISTQDILGSTNGPSKLVTLVKNIENGLLGSDVTLLHERQHVYYDLTNSHFENMINDSVFQYNERNDRVDMFFKHALSRARNEIVARVRSEFESSDFKADSFISRLLQLRRHFLARENKGSYNFLFEALEINKRIGLNLGKELLDKKVKSFNRAIESAVYSMCVIMKPLRFKSEYTNEELEKARIVIDYIEMFPLEKWLFETARVYGKSVLVDYVEYEKKVNDLSNTKQTTN